MGDQATVCSERQFCEYCGSPATAASSLCRYDWPGWPGGIWLHSQCEAPWADAEGQDIDGGKYVGRDAEWVALREQCRRDDCT